MRIGHDVAREGSLGAIRTARIDPPRVGHQWQADLLLEGRQTIWKQVRRGAVTEDAVLAIVPAGVRSFRVPPAVQLQVAEGDRTLVEFAFDGQQRARIAELRLEPVVVRRAVVRPVAELVECDVRVIRGPRFGVQRGHGCAPRVEDVIEPVASHEERLLRIPGWKRSNARINSPTEQAIAGEAC